MEIVKSVALFFFAGLAEIGGGYLMWIWLRRQESFMLGLLGAAALVLYGVIPTFQTAHFGRVYAAYGGVFVVMSLLWAWGFDGRAPDRYDLLGAALVVVGVGIIMYWPRGAGA